MNKEKRAKQKNKVWIGFPRKLVLLFSFLFSFFSFELNAQNSGYFFDSGSGEMRFIQRLTWSEDEYARRYEVIIEKEEGTAYRELLREFTTALFIQVSLLPGNYRCRVITHDFMNRPGPVPEWKYIEVLVAPDLEVANKTDDIELVHQTGETEQSEQSLSEQFHLAGIPVDLFLSAAWTPTFTISDEGKNFYKRNMSLCGVTVRPGAVSARSYFNLNPGLELPVSYNFFKTGAGENAHLLTFGLNLSALKQLPDNRMSLTFRLGAGYGILFTNDADTAASFSGGRSFHINMGVSFLLFVMDRVFLETGLDYAHWFTSPASYYFKPRLGVGFCK